MATVTIDQQQLRVELSWWERPFAGGRHHMSVPRTAIASIERVDRPTRWAATPGGRAGLLVTGVLKVGRWGVGTGTSRFVSVRRWRPAVRVAVDDHTAAELGYDELVISTLDADTLVAELATRS